MNNQILEFGVKRENEERRDGGCAIVFDPQEQKYAVGQQRDNGLYRLFSGGVDELEAIEDGILREVVEESGLHEFAYVEKTAEAITHYHNSLKNVDRVAHATCLLVVLKSSNTIPVKHEAHENFDLVWVTAEDLLQNWESRNSDKGNDHWIYFLRKSVARAKELGYDKSSKI